MLLLPKFIFMALNSILKIFLPKDKIFFHLFENVGETVIQMAAKLKQVVYEKEFDKAYGDYPGNRRS